MTSAHGVALILIPFLALGGSAAAILSSRLRDVSFFCLVALAVLTERLDVHFFSEAWYRGTTRGIEVSLLEVFAISVVAGCCLGRPGSQRPGYWPASLGLILLYLLYSVISVVVSTPKLFGLFELSKMVGAILVFVAAAMYVRSRREWTVLVLALGCAVSLEGIWAVKQRLFTGLDRVSGSLDHANSLSMYLCLATPLLAAVAHAGWSKGLRRFCMVCVALATAGELLTVSRAGVPIFALCLFAVTVACISLRITLKRVAVGMLLAVAIVAAIAGSWSHLQERYAEASLQEEYFDPNIDGRGIYLRLADAIASDHFFGVGLNNWSYYVSRTYGPRLGFRFADYDFLVSVYGKSEDIFAESYLAAPAHNLAALTLGELGVPGLLLFSVLWLRWFAMAVPFLGGPRDDPMRTMGVGILFCLCGIFGQSLTEWVYRQTPILFTLYVLLGALAGLVHMRRKLLDAERFEADRANAYPEAIPVRVVPVQRPVLVGS